tara:strand:- start:779 stop:1420 length:642 start_codon:yes stop_codon:yes gene_type:complete
MSISWGERMKVLDLCSGLGGFSEAFHLAGHSVVRIENNPLLRDVPNTTLMCIFEFRDWIEDNLDKINESKSSWCTDIDLIVFSPPCLEFSVAYNAPRANHEREFPNVPWDPSMDILECGMDIISMLKPTWHIVENVRGAIKYFKEDLGSPRQINDAYVFWGNFPSFAPRKFPSKSQKDSRHSPIRANIRGQIPIEISNELLFAIQSQKSILDY